VLPHEHAEALLQTAKRETARHAGRLQELQHQQQKLLHLFYKGAVAEEVLTAEQKGIEVERSEARRWGQTADKDVNDIHQAFREALRLLENPRIAYKSATPQVRRLLNQALFKALLIRDEDVMDAEPTAWVAEIHRLAGTSLARQEGFRNAPGPLLGGQGFNKTKMVPRAGLEPAPPD
jgi:hypothetical protein